MRIYELNWIQNGYDCGPTVCQIIDIIWTQNFSQRHGGFWRKPPLPCCHDIRKRIATDIHEIVLTNIERFHLLVGSHPPDVLDQIFATGLQESIQTVADIQRQLQPNPGVVLQQILDALNHTMRTCHSCKHSPTTVARGNKPLPGVRFKPRDEEEGEEEVHDSEDEFQGSDVDVGADAKQSAAILNKPFHVKDWNSATMGRFPRPTPPPNLPPLTTRKGLRIPHDPEYDEYETGPTLEALDPIPDTIVPLAEINLVYIAHSIITNPWATFRDYGYRIEPDFTQAFHLHPPIMVKEHIMPVGLPDQDDQETEDPFEIQDLKIMGPKEMMSMASVTGSNSILLTGKTPDGKYVKLDLEIDAVAPMAITKAVDIDSVIWVTRFPRFRRAISIFSKPIIRNRPPIFRHNHVYIDLLVPQSEDDRENLGSRTEWWSKTFKLHQIPHLQLGKMGDGAGSINLFMAFPRMSHKHPYLRGWVNNIPSHVQNILWDHVILPAMRAVIHKVNLPYLSLDRANLSFKENQQGASKSMPTFPLSKEEFGKLTKQIRFIVSLVDFHLVLGVRLMLPPLATQIEDSAGKLAQFGSHFYILEIKGCKGFTKQVVDDMEDVKDTMKRALDTLHDEFSGLDWPYMSDRMLGELFCDMGITYHPEDERPLVGLWKLDALEASFGAGGYRKGQLHNINTLSRYGGLQAEMGSPRFKRTHLTFRSSYNLAYEVTRRTSNARDLFKEKDVHRLQDNFLSDKDTTISAYQGKASETSYGVRDEFRVGYAALTDLAEGIDELVS
jgi:hypothetical protein